MTIAPWFRGQTWKALWIAVRRAPRDRTAREHLLRFLFAITIFIMFVGVYIYVLHGFASEYGLGQLGLVSIPGAVVMLIMFVAMARQNAEQRNLERESPSVSPQLKRDLFHETCLLVTLLERLGSETVLEKEIPPEIEVITRRVLLDRLDALGLREGLEPWLLDLLLAPDGHWTAEQKLRAAPAWEYFSVLRWTLGLGELRGLTLEPKYSIADVRALFAIKQPEKLAVLPSWDLRPARNIANHFFFRCWAELVARRAVGSAAETDVERALEVRAEIQQAGYTGDYLIGARTIPEIETPLLFLVTRRAYNRWQVLGLLVDIMSGDAPVGRLRQFLAHSFAPREVAESISAEETQ